jgi:hypothetical protein
VRRVSSSNSNCFSAGATRKGRRFLLFFPLLLAGILLASNHSARAAAVIYSTGFEASQGYNLNLDLVGQNGWTNGGSGGNGLLNGVFPGHGQQAYIGFSPPLPGDSFLFVYQPINKSLPHVQFSVNLSVFDSTNTNWDDFYWSVFNQRGDLLFSLDFDNFYLTLYYSLDGSNSRVSSGLLFTNSAVYPLTLDMDFTSNLWSATFNGALVASNQPITTIGSPLNLGDIDAGWVVYNTNAPGDNYMVFDDYLITASLPPPRLAWLGMAGGAPALHLVGTPNMAFAIDASTNLAKWIALKTNLVTGGSFDYVDNGALGLPRRFYRARWVP